MSDAELRRLIEGIVRSILTGARSATPIVIVGGSPLGLSEAAAAMGAPTLAHARVFLSKCHLSRHPQSSLPKMIPAGQLIDRDRPIGELESAISAAPRVVWLLPEIASVVRLSQAAPQTMGEKLLFHALANGRPVHAAGGELDPASWPAEMPPTMRRGRNSLEELLSEARARLELWGMRFHPRAGALIADMQPAKPEPESPRLLPLTIRGESAPKRRFILAEDVYKLREDGHSSWRVPPGAILTDQARDVAATLSIQLIEEA